jgi:hypothetical protein
LGAGTLGAGALVGLVAFSSGERAEAAPRIHVHGTSTFDVTTSRGSGTLNFQGRLRDDTGRALGGKTVQARVTVGSEHGEIVPVQRCALPVSGEFLLTLKTNDSGWFCASVIASGDDPYFAHFLWSGDAEVDGATLLAKADPSHRALQIDFRPVPSVIDLDKTSQEIDVEAHIQDEDAKTSLGPVPLRLSDEGGRALGQTSLASGKAAFTVPGGSFGPPGQGELRVMFDGDGFTSPALRVAPVIRRASVLLAPLGALRPQDPEEGARVPLRVTLLSGDPVPTGIVEATYGGRAVGSATVDRGGADLVVTFPVDPDAKTADLQIRYVSDTPWYVRGDSLDVPLPLATGHPARKAVLLLASLVVVLWLALARRRPALAVPKTKPAVTPPPGKPGIAVVRAVQDARVGWSGRVLDAHDGVAIAEVEVRLERPSFTGSDLLARTVTGTGGRFELRYDSSRKGDRLIASAPFHETVNQGLPAFGEIEVALVARKRALLERLVQWAKAVKGGKPGRIEPTPGLVARSAVDPKVEQWARAVEAASFGPDPVDAQAEAVVESLAPRRR